MRYSSGAEQTKYTYTGQYSYTSDFGLMFYNARWYDSSLGRFTQADSIIPAGVQGHDRYAYVSNNPLKYTDPTGHVEACGEIGESCKHADTILKDFGITTSGLSNKQKWTVANAAARSGVKLFNSFKDKGYASPLDAFRSTHGEFSITVLGDPIPEEGNCVTEGNSITCHQAMNLSNALHEFGHVLDNLSGLMASDLDAFTYKGNNIDGGTGNAWVREYQGFLCVNDSSCLEHPARMGYSSACNNTSSPKCIKEKKMEHFADLYMNWVLDGSGDINHGFRNDDLGNGRREFMKDQFNWLYSNRYLP